MSAEFNPDWLGLMPPEDVLQVALTLTLSKHVPGWPGATDEQLERVARDLIDKCSAAWMRARNSASRPARHASPRSPCDHCPGAALNSTRSSPLWRNRTRTSSIGNSWGNRYSTP